MKSLIKLILITCMVTVSMINVNAQTPVTNQDPNLKIVKTNAEWKKILSPDAYNITREAGTERPYTGKYWDNHEKGIYSCVCCGLNLFSSDTKFESGTGWPSFYQALKKGVVDEKTDNSLGVPRTEVLCHRCGGHLGHVFDDGPKPTGLRYCMNSGALSFTKTK